MDGFQHLAKVMVAGSNPVVRSKDPAELVFSVATVDVGAMIDAQDFDGH
jgi:hypothetical protein